MPFKLSDLYRDAAGKFDPAKAATSAGMAALAYGALNQDSGLGRFLGLGSNQRPVGYSKGIPEYTATRALVPNAFATTAPTTTEGPGMMAPRRPGSGGRRYFTDMAYTPTGKTMGPKASGGVFDSLTQEEASYFLNNMFGNGGLGGTQTAAKPKYTTAQVNDTLGTLVNQYKGDNQGLYRDVGQRIKAAVSAGDITLEDAANQIAGSNLRIDGKSLTPQEIIDAYKGMGFAQGGSVMPPQTRGYYLGGATDGMADEIPATIEDTQPAALSDGEFVIPADVVSHLGNGNSDAGARQLYSMMDRIRQARTGRTEQGRKINPNKYIPV